MPGSMDGLKLAHAVHERWPPIKIILVSGQLKLANIDIPADSRFFWKAACGQGNDCPDARHDRPGLTAGINSQKTPINARLRQKPRPPGCERDPTDGDI